MCETNFDRRRNRILKSKQNDNFLDSLLFQEAEEARGHQVMTKFFVIDFRKSQEVLNQYIHEQSSFVLRGGLQGPPFGDRVKVNIKIGLNHHHQHPRTHQL